MWHIGQMAQDVCPVVSGEDRARLEAIVADRNRSHKHVLRARVILQSAERVSVAAVARRVGVDRPAVWRWQRRLALTGGRRFAAGVPPASRASRAFDDALVRCVADLSGGPVAVALDDPAAVVGVLERVQRPAQLLEGGRSGGARAGSL
jgi:transposase-like protein